MAKGTVGQRCACCLFAFSLFFLGGGVVAVSCFGVGVVLVHV